MIEQDALMVLNAVPGVGNARIRDLLARYGSASRVLSLSETDLTSAGLPSRIAGAIARFPGETFLERERQLMAKHGARIVTITDSAYPACLRAIPDAPAVLYVCGELAAEVGPAVAIVGARRASMYGLTVAGQFAARLAELGVTVVSGMARGVDTAAHRGVLRARGITLAVLGCGLAHIYPPENKKLFSEIVRSGAVVSEFPMATPPVAFNFPRRNRIISGLTQGIIVVEAAERSGALITADCALEQGREVYAVPGPVDSPTSRGVHNLIKQGAKLVTGIEDVLEDLRAPLTAELKKQAPAAPRSEEEETLLLTEEEALVYGYVSDRPVHIDRLAERCGKKMPLTAAVLSRLELRKLIRQLPGKLFVR